VLIPPVEFVYLLEPEGIGPTLASISCRHVVGLTFWPMSSETGFAKIAGMEEDLRLVGLRYNIAAAIFFVRTYCLNYYIADVRSPDTVLPSRGTLV
jgi:hypothetical protein